MSIFNSKHSQDYTNGRKGKPIESSKPVRKVAKKVTKLTVDVAAAKAKDLRSASNTNHKCEGYRCHNRVRTGSLVCASCMKDPNQREFVYGRGNPFEDD